MHDGASNDEGFRSFSRPSSEDASELLLGIVFEIFTDIFEVKRSL
jgi:hypothetical protein